MKNPSQEDEKTSVDGTSQHELEVHVLPEKIELDRHQTEMKRDSSLTAAKSGNMIIGLVGTTEATP